MVNKMSEGPNENCEFYEKYDNCENSQRSQRNENYENYKKSLRHQECLERCQRGPTRTANFSIITIISKICKDLCYENYENMQTY